MSSFIDVAIIGAGPYGLSLAAHLNAAGVEHRIFGVPMESWRNHMPPGMHLKSFGESSDLFEPKTGFTLEQFSRERGIAYHASRVPVSLENFVDYGCAFQQLHVPRVEAKRLISLNAGGRGHELVFDDGETVIAGKVVLAIGIVPFKHTPAELSRLPASLVSHSADYGPLDRLDGREVTVLGSGSSALDLAALLSMRGAAVTLVSRGSKLKFQSPPGRDPGLLRNIYAPPTNGLGSGWLMLACSATPQLIHQLPDRLRLAILSNTLGPSGGYFIRDQIETKVTLKLGHSFAGAEEKAGRVRLTTIAPDGSRGVIESDHVIAATGYRIDLGRLDFLSRTTLNALRTADRTPILSGNYESSVPGLHFIGVASARGFGPVMRFVVGARHPAPLLARLFSKSLARRPAVRAIRTGEKAFSGEGDSGSR